MTNLPPLPPLPHALTTREIALRQQRPADRAFLRGLYGQGRAVELALVPWSAAAKEAFLDQQFDLQTAHHATAHRKGDFLIVTRGDDAIGRLEFDRSRPPWRLIEIAIDQAMRGQGIGSALIAWLQAQAPAIDLHVAIENTRAAALYRHCGFVEVESAFATHRRMLWTATH